MRKGKHDIRCYEVETYEENTTEDYTKEKKMLKIKSGYKYIKLCRISYKIKFKALANVNNTNMLIDLLKSCAQQTVICLLLRVKK